MREPNPGIVLCGEPPPNAVIVITGLGRGGTTSIAELLSTLEHLHWTGLANLEDYEFGEYIESGDRGSATWKIQSRGTRWAVKRPYIWRHAADLRAVLRDRLVWVFVFRDALAVAARQGQVSGESAERLVGNTAADLHELATFALEATEPKALVSYEKSLTQREQLRWHFGQWLHGERFETEEWIP